MDKLKLRKMMQSPSLRKHFVEYRVADIRFSRDAKKQLKSISETSFYDAFSTAKCGEDWCGYFTLELEEFWFTIIQLPVDPDQAEGLFSVWFLTYDEELQRRYNEKEMQDWVASGDIEIV
ncbi:MAG: hypothetical protein OQK09_14665 [Colwellia sp.]|nr:hypothetical protein [Colwellia sp.]MCW8863596.1 hypothetical protein [Colwellia sp.]MCW9082751.1 hypothetical protein [Colwellia sp.]